MSPGLRRQIAQLCLETKHSLLRGTRVSCTRHLRDLTHEEKPVNHARVFRDAHSVPVSPLEAVMVEKNLPLDDAEPTTCDKHPPDLAVLLLRSDCCGEEHRHPRLAAIAPCVAQWTAESDRQERVRA